MTDSQMLDHLERIFVYAFNVFGDDRQRSVKLKARKHKDGAMRYRVGSHGEAKTLREAIEKSETFGESLLRGKYE